jgi:beta propeller repeat protein
MLGVKNSMSRLITVSGLLVLSLILVSVHVGASNPDNITNNSSFIITKDPGTLTFFQGNPAMDLPCSVNNSTGAVNNTTPAGSSDNLAACEDLIIFEQTRAPFTSTIGKSDPLPPCLTNRFYLNNSSALSTPSPESPFESSPAFLNKTPTVTSSFDAVQLMDQRDIPKEGHTAEPDYLKIITPGAAAGTETALNPGTESSDQYNNAIFGDIAAWIDPVKGSNEVRVLNISSGKVFLIPHTNSSIRRSTPSIWQDSIVYSEDTNWINHIWIYNITTDTRVPLTTNHTVSNQNQPAIFNNNVVFTDDLNLYPDVFLYQLGTGQESLISSGMNETSHYSPTVTDDLVVWTGDHGGTIDLYCYRIRDGNRFVIANSTGDYYYQTPSVSGDSIVWQDHRSQSFDIYLYNLTTGNETLLTPGMDTTHQMFPSIWKDRVVFIDRENNSDNVILLNLTTGEQCIVVSGLPDTKANPKIWGDRIIWEDYRNNEWDIYLFTLGESRSPVGSDFAVNTTIGEVPFNVRFTDKSTGNPISHLWDFGDGNVSYESNPVHTYLVPGTYSISLTVGTSFSRDNKKVEDLITAGAPPTASFISAPISGPVPLLVTFTDTSAGYPDTWNWDFGDNTTSNEKNPSHTYYSPGEYSALLNASNPYGNSTARRSVHVVNATRNEVPVVIPGLIDYFSETGSFIINTSQASLFEFIFSENNTTLTIIPKEEINIARISLESLDSYGFFRQGSTISGNLTGIDITSRDLGSPLFDDTVGREAFTNISVEIPTYSPDCSIETVINSQIPEDEYEKLVRAVWDEQYAGGVTGTAYIVRCIKKNLTETGPATITMGVGHAWLEEHSPYVSPHDRFKVRMVHENNTYTELDTKFLSENVNPGLNYYSVTADEAIDPGKLWVVVWNSSLNLEDAHISMVSPINPGTTISTPIVLSVDSGWVTNNTVNEWQYIDEPVTIIRIDDAGNSEILATKFLYYDPVKDVDVFQGDSPHGLSEFALVTVNNPGNPLQMLYLSVANRANPSIPTGNLNPGGSGGGGGNYGGSGNQVTSTSEPDTSKGGQSETAHEMTSGESLSNNGESAPKSQESVFSSPPNNNPVPQASQVPVANPPVLPPQPTNSIFSMIIEAAAIVSIFVLVVFSVYMRNRKQD